MSEPFGFELPALGRIETIKDACRDNCPEGRPQRVESMVQAAYDDIAPEAERILSNDLAAQADPSQRIEIGSKYIEEDMLAADSLKERFTREFKGCSGPCHSILGRRACGMK